MHVTVYEPQSFFHGSLRFTASQTRGEFSPANLCHNQIMTIAESEKTRAARCDQEPTRQRKFPLNRSPPSSFLLFFCDLDSPTVGQPKSKLYDFAEVSCRILRFDSSEIPRSDKKVS